MTRPQRLFIIAFAVGGAAAVAVADQPYRQTTPVRSTGNGGGAQLVLPAREHPQVEVDRALSAQPVHPWMAEVQIGGNAQRAGAASAEPASGQMTTFVDPLNDLTARGLDDNHSLVRAQRLHRSLTGMSTRALNELRNRAHEASEARRGGSKARVIHGTPAPAARDRTDHAEPASRSPRPIMIIPKPRLEVERHPGRHIEIRTVPAEPGEGDAPRGGPDGLMAGR